MGGMRLEMEIREPIVANLRLPLEALTVQDVRYLRAHPRTPRLYNSGIRWQMEGVNPCTGRPAEHFATIPEVLAQGWGDCEDLACWRAAELRLMGHRRARAFAVRSGHMNHPQLGRVRLIHILVTRDGTPAFRSIEDPSVAMGMKPIPVNVLRAAVRRDFGAR